MGQNRRFNIFQLREDKNWQDFLRIYQFPFKANRRREWITDFVIQEDKAVNGSSSEMVAAVHILQPQPSVLLSVPLL